MFPLRFSARPPRTASLIPAAGDPRPIKEAASPRRRTMDVAVVPDFRNANAPVQEAQLLFLLASWIEQAAHTGWPTLHLACIGEPPLSVARLAERAGAVISVHAPAGIHPRHHVGNKLRGLEVDSEADSLLLLDADTLVLSDIRQLAAWSDGLAAAPDDCPKLTRSQWATIYSGLGLTAPSERATCLADELELPQAPAKLLGQKIPRDHCEDSLPYFNSGVLLVPRECELADLWKWNIRRIASLFPEEAGPLKWIHRSDQAGLAVSVQMLRAQGWRFRRLPATVNARWRNLYAGDPPLDHVSVLHLTTFLHGLAPGALTTDRLLAAARRYLHGKLARRFGRLALAELCNGRMAGGWNHLRAGRRAAQHLEAILRRLVERHIGPALS